MLKIGGGIAGLIAIAATTLALSAGVASAATPAKGYEQFAGCQTVAENPSSEFCIHSVIKGGHFQMGSKDVPISSPIVLTGNVDAELEHFSANAQGGLKPAKQKVPGGVVGLTGLTWLLEFLGSEALTLYAVTEAVGAPSLSFEEISLPIRVHLVNSTLGSHCYVGSASDPISLHLTTGTTSPPAPNSPISGQEPEVGFEVERGILEVNNGVYVDNSFSAPGANGCTLTLFGFIPISINGLVNAQSGLPAAAGSNETVQEIDTAFAETSLVYP